MKKRIVILTVVLCLCGALLYCLWQKPFTPVRESEGKTAVLFSSLVPMWQQAGGSVEITVGESVERGFVSEETLLVDEGAGKSIHTELLVSYAPRLVIYSADIPAQAQAAALLEQNGVKTLGCKIDSFADYKIAMEQLCALTGNNDALQEVTRLQAQIDRICVRQPFAGKTVLFVRAGSTAASTKAKQAEDHFAAAMLEELGARNITDSTPVLLDNLSMEAVLAADPDYIFFSLMGKESAARENVNGLLQSPTWSVLTAVKEGRAHILPKDLFHYKPCARWGEAYEYLEELA